MNRILINYLKNLDENEIKNKYEKIKKSNESIKNFIFNYTEKHPSSLFVLSGGSNDITLSKKYNKNQNGGTIEKLMLIFNKYELHDIDKLKDSMDLLETKIKKILKIEIEDSEDNGDNKRLIKMLEEIKNSTKSILDTSYPNKKKINNCVKNKTVNSESLKFIPNGIDLMNKIVYKIANKIKLNAEEMIDDIFYIRLNTLANEFLNKNISESEFSSEYNKIIKQEEYIEIIKKIDLPRDCFDGKYVKRYSNDIVMENILTSKKIDLIEEILLNDKSEIFKTNCENIDENIDKIWYYLFLILIVTNNIYENHSNISFYNYFDNYLVLFYSKIIKQIILEIELNSHNLKTIDFFKKYHKHTLKIIDSFLDDLFISNGFGLIIDIEKSSKEISHYFLLFNYFKDFLHLYLMESSQTNISSYIKITKYSQITHNLLEPFGLPKNNITNIFDEELKITHMGRHMNISTCLENGKNILLTTIGNTGSGKTFNLFGNLKFSYNSLIQSIISNISNINEIQFRMFELYGQNMGNYTKEILFKYDVRLNLNNLVYVNNHSESNFEKIAEHIKSPIESSYVTIPINIFENIFNNLDDFFKQIKITQLENNTIKSTPISETSSRSVMFFDFILKIGEKNVKFLIVDTPSIETIDDIFNLYVDSYFNFQIIELIKNSYSEYDLSIEITKIKIILKILLLCPDLSYLFDNEINKLELRELLNLKKFDKVLKFIKKIISNKLNSLIRNGSEIIDISTIAVDSILYNFETIVYESLYSNQLIKMFLNENFDDSDEYKKILDIKKSLLGELKTFNIISEEEYLENIEELQINIKNQEIIKNNSLFNAIIDKIEIRSNLILLKSYE